jgi:hypothetical protein
VGNLPGVFSVVLLALLLILSGCTSLSDMMSTPAPIDGSLLTAATATFESTATPTPTPSPTTILTLTPWPTVSLPKPRFSVAPTGTILAVQYRYIISETFSPANPDRPFYLPRDLIAWAIPAEGKPYRWLDDGRDKVQMQISPDYSQVAYVVNSQYGEFTSVWVANADGSNPRQLTPAYPAEDAGGHVYLTNSAWSPDGQKLAYVFNYKKGYKFATLYIIDVPVKKVIKMNIERVRNAHWVNNRLLRVYQEFDEMTMIDIYTQEITPIADSTPVPGQMVEYDPTPGSEKITVYAADGSELYQLDLSGWPIWPSTLSPDFKWLVLCFSGDDTNPPGIYKVSKDHPQPQLVLQGFEFVYEGERGRIQMDTNLALKQAWSPDDRWFLVLNQFNGKGGQELYAVNVETNEVRTVMEFETLDLYVEGVDQVVWLK